MKELIVEKYLEQDLAHAKHYKNTYYYHYEVEKIIKAEGNLFGSMKRILKEKKQDSRKAI